MARYAIGDVQGCAAELRALLKRAGFSPDRDQLWFVGDLVNRGPRSLDVLRCVRRPRRRGRRRARQPRPAPARRRARRPAQAARGDTLEEVLQARATASLLDWLLQRPLAWQDAGSGELLMHAGLVPQWSARRLLRLAH